MGWDGAVCLSSAAGQQAEACSWLRWALGILSSVSVWSVPSSACAIKSRSTSRTMPASWSPANSVITSPWQPRRQSRHRAGSGIHLADSDATVPDLPRQLRLSRRSNRAVFTRYFGRDDVAFSITWAEPAGPGITRSYAGFRQLADEAARSRVYGGIHFNFDTTSSFGVCIPLGDYVFENTFRRQIPQ